LIDVVVKGHRVDHPPPAGLSGRVTSTRCSISPGVPLLRVTVEDRPEGGPRQCPGRAPRTQPLPLVDDCRLVLLAQALHVVSCQRREAAECDAKKPDPSRDKKSDSLGHLRP